MIRGPFTRKIYDLKNVLKNVSKWIFDSETCTNYSISWKMSWAYWEQGAFLTRRFQSWFNRSKNDVLKNVFNSRHFQDILQDIKFFLVNRLIYDQCDQVWQVVTKCYQVWPDVFKEIISVTRQLLGEEWGFYSYNHIFKWIQGISWPNDNSYRDHSNIYKNLRSLREFPSCYFPDFYPRESGI